MSFALAGGFFTASTTWENLTSGEMRSRCLFPSTSSSSIPTQLFPGSQGLHRCPQPPLAFPKLGTGGRWGRGLSWRHSEAHLPCCAPGCPDILQSRSDRCIQINQSTAGKGSESSKSSETRSGLEGQKGATSEGARRPRPRARPSCWCSYGSRRGPSPAGVFLSLLLAPGGCVSSPPSTGLLIHESDGPHV